MIFSIFKDCNKVSIHSQSNDSEMNMMRRARQMFDGLAEKYLSMSDHFKHVHCVCFENCVVKLQNGEKPKRTPRGKRSIKEFYFQQIMVISWDLRRSFPSLTLYFDRLMNKKLKTLFSHDFFHL